MDEVNLKEVEKRAVNAVNCALKLTSGSKNIFLHWNPPLQLTRPKPMPQWPICCSQEIPTKITPCIWILTIMTPLLICF